MQYDNVFYLCRPMNDVHHKNGLTQKVICYQRYFTCPLKAVNAVISNRRYHLRTNRYLEPSRRMENSISYDDRNITYPTIFSVPQPQENPKNSYLATKAELKENGIVIECVGVNVFYPFDAKNAFFNYKASNIHNTIDLKECLKVEYDPPKVKMIANYEHHYTDGSPIKYWYDMRITDRPPDKKKYDFDKKIFKKIVLHSVIRIKTGETNYSIAS